MNEQIQYIGARYVVKIYENKTNPSTAEWDAGVNYEPLTLVTYNFGSYLSKKDVPASVGNPADNPTYWCQTGFSNGQIVELKHEIEGVESALSIETLNRINSDTAIETTLNNFRTNTEADITSLENKDTELQNAINGEISNRTTAVNQLSITLSGAITSEATTRSAEDARLEAEIQQLIAPSGEAPNPAEIQDARIAADGILYASLGAAIRAQVGDLEKATGFFSGPWVRKTIMSNGQLDDSTTRVAMSSRLYIEKDGFIVANPSGQKYWFYIYNDSSGDATSSDGAWSTSIKAFRVTAGSYVNVVVAKTDDGTIWPQERSAMFAYIPINAELASDITQMCMNYSYWKEVKNKRVNTAAGRVVYFTDDDYRLSTPNVLYADAQVVISFPNTYRISVLTVDSNGIFISETGWSQYTQTINAGTYFHLTFKKADESAISFADIENFTFTDTSKTDFALELAESNKDITNKISNIETNIPIYNAHFNKLDVQSIAFNSRVKGIAHRGLASVYPENTLIAFKGARKFGFRYVEFDVQTTSDGVYVILHDDTINRTARNSDGTEISSPISINNITYADALNYDFGIYKGAEFAGTTIPTLDETLALCHDLGIVPIIELKYASINTQEKVDDVIDLVKKYNLQHDCYFSVVSYPTVLQFVKNTLPTAKLIWCGWNAFSSNDLIVLNNLKSNINEVVCSLPLSLQTEDSLANAIDSGFPLSNGEAANFPSTIQLLPKCLTWIYSEALLPEQVLYEYAISD